MRVRRETAAQRSEKTKGEKPTSTKRKQQKKPAETSFSRQGVDHGKKLDPHLETHTPVPQRDVHGGHDELRTRVDAGALKRLSRPPDGLDLSSGVDIGGAARPEFNGRSLTQRTAFEHDGKVFVLATEWETPGKVWFELGPKRAPPPAPEPSAAEVMRDRIGSRILTALAGPPEGISGPGLMVGGGGRFQGQLITERRVFEVQDRLYIAATIWEQPAHQWFKVN